VAADPDVERLPGRRPGATVGKDAAYAVKIARLPNAAVLRFPTIETYSDGHQDAWIEVGVDPNVEPQLPAPALKLTGATGAAGAGTALHSQL
jgi:Domain of unkown function (DUF1775)